MPQLSLKGKQSMKRRNAGRRIWAVEPLEARRLLAVGPSGHEYQLIEGELTWRQAQEAAAQLIPPVGFATGQLVTIGDAAENDFLRQSLGLAAGKPAWTGFTDQAEAGVWKWNDDTPGIWQDGRLHTPPQQTAYVNWAEGQPELALASVRDVSAFRSNRSGPNRVSSELIGEFESILAYIAEAPMVAAGSYATQISNIAPTSTRFISANAWTGFDRNGLADSTIQVGFSLARDTRASFAGNVTPTSSDPAGNGQFSLLHQGQPFFASESNATHFEFSGVLPAGRYDLDLGTSNRDRPPTGGVGDWDLQFDLLPEQAGLIDVDGKWQSASLYDTAPYYVVEFVPSESGPTDIGLSPAIVPENSPNGTVIGLLSSVDPDQGDSFTYTLLNDAGGRFVLNGDQVKAANGALLDHESAPSYVIRVRTTDSTGFNFEKDLVIQVADVNEAPTDLSLSKVTFPEGTGPGYVIGELSAFDPDASDQLTFTVVSQKERFAIEGNQLVTREALPSNISGYHVVVRATDLAGHSIEKGFLTRLLDTPSVVSSIVGPNGHRYDLVAASRLWQEADAEARSSAEPAFPNAHLVTIDNAAEDLFLAQSLELPRGQPAWMGFSDQAELGTWRWVDDTPGVWQDSRYHSPPQRTAYVNWADGEPRGRVAQFFVGSGWTTTVLDQVVSYYIVEYEPNATPVDLTLTKDTVPENATEGTLIGQLSAVDGSGSHTFALQNDAGGRVQLVGNQVTVAGGLDFEKSASHVIRVKVTDSGGLSFEKDLTIHVTNVNERPLVGVPSAQVAKPGQALALSGIVLSDPDLQGTDLETKPLRLTLEADQGTLQLGSLVGLTISAGANGSSSIALQGSLNALNAALGTLSHQAANGFTGLATLSVSLDDLGHTGEGPALTESATLSIQINTPPVAVSDHYEIDPSQTLRANSYRQAVLESNPVAYWRLGDSGPTVEDVVGDFEGAPSAGTVLGVPGALVGDSNTAGSFPDVNTRILVDGADALAQPTGAFTVEAWVNPSQPMAWQRIASTRNGPMGGWGFALSNQRLTFTTFGIQDYFLAGHNVPLNQWSHVAVVFDANHDASFFLNGAFVGKIEGAAPPNPGGSLLAIGDNPDQSAQPFLGKLDEVAFYSQPLSAAEINRHYQAGQTNRTVLVNDTDADGDLLQAVLVAQPLHGTLQFAPDGSFTYKPTAGFVGQDRFTYRAVDAFFESDETEVLIQVTAVPGDADGDGDVDLADFGLLKQHFGTTSSEGDFNGDGKVDLADFGILKAHFGTVEPGEG